MNLRDVCVVVTSRNDADTIGRCLESVRPFGATVVVDGFSTDGTADVARERGAVVYRRPSASAAEQKNWAISRATLGWVLTLDACEEVSDALRRDIAAADCAADAYVVPVAHEYLGARMKSAAAAGHLEVRLFAHGRPAGQGLSRSADSPPGKLDGEIVRREFRDLHRHFDALNRRTSDAARRFFEGGGRLAGVRMLVVPGLTFWRNYLLGGGIRDGARGLMYCLMGAYERFIEYAKAWELGRRAGRERRATGGGRR